MTKFKIGDKIKILNTPNIRHHHAETSIGQIITFTKKDINEIERNIKYAKQYNVTPPGIILLDNKYKCNYQLTDFKLHKKSNKHQIFNI